MNQQQSDIDHLISLYLSGHASDRQRQELEEWLARSSKNRAIFHRLEKIWSTSTPAEYNPKMDEVRDRIWKNAIFDRQPVQELETRFAVRPVWIRAAAIILMFLGGAWLFTELNKTEEVLPLETRVWVEKSNPTGQRSSHLLPDGTKVWLNVASQLYFPEEFSDTLRRVKLLGEAFFEVSKDADRAFVVETEGFNTLVLGTSFNVHAYPEDPEIKVALLEGRVRVHNRDLGQTSVLVPGEELRAPKDNSAFSKRAFDYEKTFGWKEGILVFDGANFQTFRKTIEKWYGVKVELQGTAPVNWNIRARYQRASLPHVLEDISFNKDLKYDIKDRVVSITF